MRLKHLIEYGLFRGLGGLFRLLPYRLALTVGWTLAGMGHHLFRFRVREAHARIREVLGEEVPPAEVRRIAWISFRNLCFNIVEVARSPKLTPEWITRHVEIPGLEALRTHLESGRGAVMATPHMGNWDIAGIGLHLLGYPIFFIARQQSNLLVDGHLNHMRKVTGARIFLNHKHIIRDILRELKHGGILALLPDVRARTPALQITYLDKPANIAGGIGLFARLAHVPVFPVILLRDGWSRQRWIIYPPLHPHPEGDKTEEAHRLTQTLMHQFSAAVRAHPEQYFWYNKRWVLEPFSSPS